MPGCRIHSCAPSRYIHRMPVLHKLLQLYRQRGHEIVFGVHPKFSGLDDSEAAHIITCDRHLTHHLGIYPGEIYFLEHLLSEFHPKRIFVIGNSFGWSTFALAMLAPQATVLAIEAGAEPFTESWIEQSNSIAADANLRVRVQKGISPPDVDRVAPIAGGPFDLVFVDGMHTSKQAVQDYTAVARHSHDATIFLFHDVVLFNMV